MARGMRGWPRTRFASLLGPSRVGLSLALPSRVGLSLALPSLIGLSLVALSLTGLPTPTAASTPGGAPHLGDEACVSAEVVGALAEACARRDRFGARWTLAVTDTAGDGLPVRADVQLEVVGGRDGSAVLDNRLGEGATIEGEGTFSPIVGVALGDVSVKACVVARLGRDRCEERSVALPQLESRASAAQRARLEELVFEKPLAAFLAVRAGEHTGVDATFDWGSDGCSGGPLGDLLDTLVEPACLRHDFAYRNYGRLGYGPTDAMRMRVEEQLAADVAALGRAPLAPSLREALLRFGATAFFGREFDLPWGVPMG